MILPEPGVTDPVKVVVPFGQIVVFPLILTLGLLVGAATLTGFDCAVHPAELLTITLYVPEVLAL